MRALERGCHELRGRGLAYSILIDTHREHHRVAGLGAPSFGAPAHGTSALIKTGGSYATDLHPSDKLASVFISNDNLSSALSALKLEEREALLLVSLEGFTYAEVARILENLPPHFDRASFEGPRKTAKKPAGTPSPPGQIPPNPPAGGQIEGALA